MDNIFNIARYVFFYNEPRLLFIDHRSHTHTHTNTHTHTDAF